MTASLLALAIAWLAPAPASAADGEILFNQTFHGLIDSFGDQDTVEFEEAQGSQLTVVVKAKGGNDLHPTFELLDQGLNPIDLGTSLKLNGKKAVLKKFPLPYSGTYTIRVASANGLTGTYKVAPKGKVKKKYQVDGDIGTAGEVDEIVFSARAGGRLSGTLTRKSGDFIPTAFELLSPAGVPVALAKSLKLSKGQNKLTIDGVDLPLLGEYTLRVTGLGGTLGDYSANLQVTSPKPLSGKVIEPGLPGSGPDDGPGITLQEVFFARGLRTIDGASMDLVSPFSVVRTDPISDLPIPGTLEGLFPSTNLKELVPFHLGPIYGPPVVPRNAVLVLRFNKKPALASLNLDGDRLLTDESPLVLTVNGVPVVAEVFLSGKDIILNPVFGEQVGFPASPVAFDGAGNPAANSTGSALLSLPSTGPNILMSLDGEDYAPRADGLGSPDAGGEAIGFNPGNAALDFFAQMDVGAGSNGYRGFLPDHFAPRLIRELKFAGVYTPDFVNPQNGDIIGFQSFSIVTDEPFDVLAHGGKGEWAGGAVRLRPGEANAEQHAILQNVVFPLPNGKFRNEAILASSVVIPLLAGEAYEWVRAEYFEPDLANPIDPELFDPSNPELVNNSDIENFIEARDRNGNLQSLEATLDPRTEFTYRFSEPMALDTFRSQETFFVSENANGSASQFQSGINQVGFIKATNRVRALTFQPHRLIQFGPLKGSTRLVGLRENAPQFLHLKVVPSEDVLAGLLQGGLQAFLDQGERGVTDLGGQPLAFPKTAVSSSNPVIDYVIPFTTGDDPQLIPHGAIVHRFLGAPTTGFDGAGNTGIAFRDVPASITGGSNLYGPKLADLNLFTNGFLSGAPVQFFTKIHDDFNPPTSQDLMTPFPFGASTPIGGFAVLGGARFQHVYRAVDCSPDWEALAGTNLDLYHIAYAPIGGFVTETVLPDISVHAGHTAYIPDTAQSGGIPSHPNSGLAELMNNNYDAVELATGITHQRQIVAGTQQGTTTTGVMFKISNDNLFTPIGTQHPYHPIPDEPFTNPFAYNNGARDVKKFVAPQFGGAVPSWGGKKNDPRPESLLLEYRVRVVDNENPPATQNGFTFAVGLLSSALPRFRVYSMGAGCLSCCFNGDGGCQNNCLTVFGPALDGTMNGGGNPLDPDLIVRAAGPAPAPPGLSCRCLKPPQNPLPPPQGCNDQGLTGTNQTIEAVAKGAAQPSQNNYGDNSRYFMVFSYVKRESYILSPFVKVQPSGIDTPTYLEPIFDPPLDQIPVGTTFDVRFRSSQNGGSTGGSASAWVTPAQMTNPNNAVNSLPIRPFLQFEAKVNANTSTQLTPVFDEVAIPFRH